jgi:hypothetical protein
MRVDDWRLLFHPEFGDEFRELPNEAKIAIGVVFDLLREFGPRLGRPQVDTLKGSRHTNMKEIRVQTGRDWYRLAFAFDVRKQAVVLCGGTKGGISQDRFYRWLITTADGRFDEWLEEQGNE